MVQSVNKPNKRRSSRKRSASRTPKPVVSKDGKTATFRGKKYDVVTWKNGTRAIYLTEKNKNGKEVTRPRIIGGSSAEYMRKLRSKSRKVRSKRASSKTR